MNNIVYVVGRFLMMTEMESGKKTAWDLLGIFTNEDEAKRQCTTKNDFVGPVEIDTFLGKEQKPWPGCYYPIR